LAFFFATSPVDHSGRQDKNTTGAASYCRSPYSAQREHALGAGPPAFDVNDSTWPYDRNAGRGHYRGGKWYPVAARRDTTAPSEIP
jgi:hypothetical protein